MGAFAWIGQFARDLRFGARSLSQTRAFTAIAIGSLALGIGGSTAMYSVIHAVILDPFPYKDPDHLMSVTVQGQRGGNGSYYPIDQFLEIAERNTVFSGVVASTWSDVTWTDAGEPQRLRGNHCTMNTFDVMGVAPLIGRGTSPSDAAEGAEPVTRAGLQVLAAAVRRRPRRAGPQAPIERQGPHRDRRDAAALHVARRRRVPARRLSPRADGGRRAQRSSSRTSEAGRHAGAGVDRSETASGGPGARPPGRFSQAMAHPRCETFGETFPSGIQDCLVDPVRRGGPAAVDRVRQRVEPAAVERRLPAARNRHSRGDGRGHASGSCGNCCRRACCWPSAAAPLGVLLAYAGLRGIIAVVPPNTIPDEAQITLNGPVLLFTLAVSVVVSLLFGVTPAFQLVGRDLLTPLKEAGRGVSGGARQRLMRSALVVAEVALSVVLLVGASLMIRTLLSIQGANLAFHPDRILTLRIPFSEQRYPDANRRNAFLQDVLRRMQTAPGVLAVGINAGMPPVYNWSFPVEAVGSSQQESRPVQVHQTNADYPRVMGLSLVQGRFLSEAEVAARTSQYRGQPDAGAALLLRRRGHRTADPDSAPAHARR